MTITQKLREDIDKQLFEYQTNMIELKYATRNISSIKGNCMRKKMDYTLLLDILFPIYKLSSLLGAPTAKYDTYIYTILKEFSSINELENTHLEKLTNLISTPSCGRFSK